MMLRATCALVVLVHFGTQLSQAAVTDCPPTLNSASAKSLYFQKPDGSWESFDSFEATGWGIGANVQFAYIVRERFLPERMGVLVVKSGRYARTDDDKRDTTVALSRAGTDYSCSRYPSAYFPDQSVSGQAYELYHDQANKNDPLITGADGATIRSFHVRYGRGCISTDDVGNASDGLASNRSQFSYSEDIVRGETRLAAAFSGSAVADPLALTRSSRRTQMFAYNIAASAFQCVQFQIKYANPAQFIYVNDLEARTNRSRNRRPPEDRYPPNR
jgi:hypothetical protein